MAEGEAPWEGAGTVVMSGAHTGGTAALTVHFLKAERMVRWISASVDVSTLEVASSKTRI